MLGGPRRSHGSGATAVRITAILTAVGCCLAAAAYATTRSLAPRATADGERSPLRPRIFGHPDRVTTKATAWFAFAQPGRPSPRARPGPSLQMECRLDDGSWDFCSAPVTLTGIGRGGHRFAVRAVNRAGVIGPAAQFVWRRSWSTAQFIWPLPVLEERLRRPAPPRAGSAPGHPQTEPAPAEAVPAEEAEASSDGSSFTIHQVGTLGDLYPGAPAQTIGVRIENPNEGPVTLTSLTAAIAADPPGCPAMENFILTPAAVSPAAPLVVAGESTVSLPQAGVAGPTIAMANLPHSQDGCEGDELEISLSGVGG